MLEYNEITTGRFIIYQGEPWEVLSAHVFRKQQRKPVNATKLRSLITGRITENSFHVSEKVEEAEIETKDIKFIYLAKPARTTESVQSGGGEYWFHEMNDQSKRFFLKEEQLDFSGKFLKRDAIAKAMIFDEKIIGVKLPIKVELKVTDAPPSTRGNTAQGGSKQVKVETGAMVNAPLFINEGDTIRVNTETGDYVERV